MQDQLISQRCICDANYCFSFVDIGAYGGLDDAGVLASSLYGPAFDTIPSALNVVIYMLPYVLLGDEIFLWNPGWWSLIQANVWMKQNGCKIIGYHKLVENAFGILTAKWSILRRAIKANVNLVSKALRLIYDYTITCSWQIIERLSMMFTGKQQMARKTMWPIFPAVFYVCCMLFAVLNMKEGGFT